VELDTGRTASQNAGDLFERAKKLEEKAINAEDALKELEARIARMRQKTEAGEAGTTPLQGLREGRARGEGPWFEKFRWFYSRTGRLVVGGRDATTNDILMKKYATEKELVFHADIVGAPFFVIKALGADGKPTHPEADPESIEDAAIAAAVFSRAWKLGYGSLSVYYAPRSQFTKEAPSGEYVKKGAFMVYGKKEWVTVEVRVAVGTKEGKLTAGPPEAIRTWADKWVVLEPGDTKPGEITRLLINELDLQGPGADRIQKALPAGKFRIIKEKGRRSAHS